MQREESLEGPLCIDRERKGITSRERTAFRKGQVNASEPSRLFHHASPHQVTDIRRQGAGKAARLIKQPLTFVSRTFQRCKLSGK
jgi:hypothetical protein